MPVVDMRNTAGILHFLATASSSGIQVGSLQLEDQMGHVATMTGAQGPNLLPGTAWGKLFSFIVCASARGFRVLLDIWLYQLESPNGHQCAFCT